MQFACADFTPLQLKISQTVDSSFDNCERGSPRNRKNGKKSPTVADLEECSVNSDPMTTVSRALKIVSSRT